MDIRVLNYFLVVAKEENITKAAGLLHVTQPTLSRQMMQLEEELGVKLFTRRKYNIALTEEGMMFRRRAQELVNLAYKAKDELVNKDSEIIGEVIIGCNESQSINELSEIISSFRKKFPQVTFVLRSGNNIEIKEWLEEGKIDVGLFVEPVDVEKFCYIRLKSRDKWGILAHVNTNLGKKELIHSEDLINVPMITIVDEAIHSELASWSGKNATNMLPIVHYNLLSNAAALVRKQEGVAVCSEPNCKYEDLRFIPFDPKLELGSLLVWKGNQRFSKASTAFIDYIDKYNIEEIRNTKNE